MTAADAGTAVGGGGAGGEWCGGAEQAATSGVDGVLCVDLPPEEGRRELVPTRRRRGLDTIFLLAPTSNRERMRSVAQSSSGFVYYVSRAGVTGERAELRKDLLRVTKKLRRKPDLPLAVGFGISTPQQVEAVAGVADGVVVGSALVHLIEEKAGSSDLVAAVEERVRILSTPLL